MQLKAFWCSTNKNRFVLRFPHYEKPCHPNWPVLQLATKILRFEFCFWLTQIIFWKAWIDLRQFFGKESTWNS